MEKRIVKCRICEKLIKRPKADYSVYYDYDPTCCESCNAEADNEYEIKIGDTFIGGSSYTG